MIYNFDGKFVDNEGNYSEGEWKYNEKNSYAIESWISGDKYQGQYLCDMKNGTGSYSWANCNSKEETYVKDQIQGFGSYKWPDDQEYTGEWFQNQMHDKGFLKWPNGNRYVGDYKENKKEYGDISQMVIHLRVLEFKENNMEQVYIRSWKEKKLLEFGIKEDQFQMNDFFIYHTLFNFNQQITCRFKNIKKVVVAKAIQLIHLVKMSIYYRIMNIYYKSLLKN